MKIAVMSDTRVPTRGVGGHGLGRMAYDVAAGLAERGHSVTLMAGEGSIAPPNVRLNVDTTELMRANWIKSGKYGAADVYIDLSHAKDLSQQAAELPVLNWIVDTECEWQPPNALVCNWWQQREFPTARIVPLGVDVSAIPLGAGDDGYLAYCAKLHPAKGFDLAVETARQANLPLRVAGEIFAEYDLSGVEYLGVIEDNAALYAFLGGAMALLAPSRMDAGGRVILEAAACGTPTITLDASGTQCHVSDGVSGFVCADVTDMVEACGYLRHLRRADVRSWAHNAHDLSVMIAGVDALALAVSQGERW